MEITGILGWTILIVIIWLSLLVGVVLGIILFILLKRMRHHLSDLEDGVKYFQDLPLSSFFFLRKEGASISSIYLIDSDKINIIGGMKDITDHPFCIVKRGDEYDIYPMEK